MLLLNNAFAFFALGKKRCLQIVDILGGGGLCALPNGITSDRLQTFMSVTVKFKHTPMKTIWRHLAENFQRQPRIFCSGYVVPIMPYKMVKTEM